MNKVKNIIIVTLLALFGIVSLCTVTYLICDLKYAGEAQATKHQLDEYETRVSELEAENERMSKQITDHGLDAVPELEGQISTLMEQVETKSSEISELTSQNEFLKTQNIDYSAQVADLESQVSELEENNSSLADYIAKAEEDAETIASLQGQISELTDTVLEQSNTIESLKEGKSMTELGAYTVDAKSFDNKSNLRNFVSLLNGRRFNAGTNISFKSCVGALTTENGFSELDASGFVSGSHFITEAIYRAALVSGLHVTEAYQNEYNYVIVNNEHDLKFDNNASFVIELWIAYNETDGTVTVKIFGV